MASVQSRTGWPEARRCSSWLGIGRNRASGGERSRPAFQFSCHFSRPLVLCRSNLLPCDQHLNDAVIFAQRLEAPAARNRVPHRGCHSSLPPKHQPAGIFVKSIGPPSEIPGEPRRKPLKNKSFEEGTLKGQAESMRVRIGLRAAIFWSGVGGKSYNQGAPESYGGSNHLG